VTLRRDVDVLVLGAGPSGAVTAAALARRGMSVLLVDGGTDVGEHDVLVGQQVQQDLASVGFPVRALSRPVELIRLSSAGKPGRSFTDAGMVASGSGRLRAGLRRAAMSAGANVVRGWVVSVVRVGGCYEAVMTGADGGSAGGVQNEADTARLTITARHVVAATGPPDGRPSAVAANARPEFHGGTPAVGIACARQFAGVALRGRARLAMAAPAATSPDAPPTCVWALPGSGELVTVAVARGADAADPGGLLAAALQTLTQDDARFSALVPAGPVVSGPLDAGFTPERVAAAGHLLVGDAAGLVNPFTGEGLTYAVHSGLLAARAIAERPSDPDAARLAYADRLAAGFVGHFEAARHAARRYHLTWRVLGAAANSEHPFFAKARRAILLPEGLAGLNPADRLDLAARDAIMLAPFLMACDEVMISAIRTRWPFLVHLVTAADVTAHPRLRPAVLFFAALLASGQAPDVRHATVGGAIELAHLGTLAFLGRPPARRPPARGVDWAVTTTVLAGDFLLAQASRLIAESAPEISWSFADWLAEMTALRAGRLDGSPPAITAGAVFASLFEFPARIGALRSGCPPATVQALRDAGHQCGHAFVHAEDMLALRGERTRLDATLRAMLDGRISAIPETLGEWPVSARRLATDPRLRSAALTAAATGCLAAHDRALDAAAAVHGPAARILRRFITGVAAPARPAGSLR
jgi:menaquinone-9 beta-reductase